jgi:predicted nucleic acid-binding protein
MAARPVLVDSSYYIDRLRQRKPLMRELQVIASNRPLATCGAIRCEVGRGIRERAARKLLHQVWSRMLYIPTDNRLWEATEELLWQLDRQGTLVPAIDALIAESARRIGAVILTLDSHFQLIPGIIAVDRIV